MMHIFRNGIEPLPKVFPNFYSTIKLPKLRTFSGARRQAYISRAYFYI